ncbi:hypothetical protein BH23CHL2_BH23CHL2_26880 [soil metagenome]
MFYGIEKAAEAHRHELLQVAQRERLARVAVGERRIRVDVRQPVGRFFVRLGSRLIPEPQREAQLAESAGNIG